MLLVHIGLVVLGNNWKVVWYEVRLVMMYSMKLYDKAKQFSRSKHLCKHDNFFDLGSWKQFAHFLFVGKQLNGQLSGKCERKT